MRGRGARNGFSPRETLSPISASTPQRTSLSNVRINPRCFSETQVTAFLPCFCRRDRVPKQIQTRNKLSGKYRNLRARFTVDALGGRRPKPGFSGYLPLSSDIRRSATCPKKSSAPVLPAASSFPVSNLYFSNINLVLSSSLFFSSLHICLICAAARTAHMPHRNSCHALPLFCAVLRVSISFDTYNSTL